MEYKEERHGDTDKIVEAKVEQGKAEIKRARKMAIAFGVITSFALISLVYAYVHDQKCKEQINKLTEETKEIRR